MRWIFWDYLTAFRNADLFFHHFMLHFIHRIMGSFFFLSFFLSSLWCSYLVQVAVFAWALFLSPFWQKGGFSYLYSTSSAQLWGRNATKQEIHQHTSGKILIFFFIISLFYSPFRILRKLFFLSAILEVGLKFMGLFLRVRGNIGETLNTSWMGSCRLSSWYLNLWVYDCGNNHPKMFWDA